MNNELWDDIRKTLSSQLTQDCTILGVESVYGGDINDAYAFDTSAGRYFVKISRNGDDDAFLAEQQGLQCLAYFQQVRIPEVVALGNGAGTPYLVLEYIALTGSAHFEQLGAHLAALHKTSSTISDAPSQPPASAPFGFANDNYIGLTRQRNTVSSEWTEFWLQHRLEPQLALALDNGYNALQNQVDEALRASETLLQHHSPDACVLHGDLWGGNKGFDEDGRPVLFDPAVYFGDREVDLALTTLFGGFDNRFYQAYQAVWPLPEGYQHRQTLYNLYHVLNHLNLFGGSYLASSSQSISNLCRLAAGYA